MFDQDPYHWTPSDTGNSLLFAHEHLRLGIDEYNFPFGGPIEDFIEEILGRGFGWIFAN